MRSKLIKTLFYKENLGRFDIRAFDCNAEPKLLKEDLFFNFKQFDGSVNVSKTDQGPAFGSDIRYLLLCCLLGFSKAVILCSITPLTSVSTCNE